MTKVLRSETDFKRAIAEGWVKHTTCRNCSMAFSKDIVFTPEGWLRTQQEGICEPCHEDIVDHQSGDSDV